MDGTREDKGIAIDSGSGIPIWLQLRNQLIYLICAGAYQPGEKLPTIREMSVDLGINYNTVGKVYQGLERDGYIVLRQGKGTFIPDVIPSGADDDPIGGAVYLADDFIRQCKELGMQPKQIVELVERQLRD